MPKIFYTRRDIQDLVHSGVTTLVINDDVVVTDLGREAAEKLGVELVREHDQPSSAPLRPYITEKISPSAAEQPAPPLKTAAAGLDVEDRVFQAVQQKVSGDVDPDLLRTIIRRVLKNIGGS